MFIPLRDKKQVVEKGKKKSGKTNKQTLQWEEGREGGRY